MSLLKSAEMIEAYRIIASHVAELLATRLCVRLDEPRVSVSSGSDVLLYTGLIAIVSVSIENDGVLQIDVSVTTGYSVYCMVKEEMDKIQDLLSQNPWVDRAPLRVSVIPGKESPDSQSLIPGMVSPTI